MAEGRDRSEWNKTASIMVKIHNTNVTKSSDAISFQDVHPYFIVEKIKEHRDREPTEGELRMLENTIKGMGSG